MRALLGLLVFAFVMTALPRLAYADEHFKFHHVICDKSKNEIKIEPVRLWNMQDRVWGDRTQSQHVALLKVLEQEHQLFIFDQDYGYADKEKFVQFHCGTLDLTIAFENYKKPMKTPEPAREIRINPVALRLEKGRVVSTNLMWNSTEAGMNAYGLSINPKATAFNVYRVKLSEDPADVTCCAKSDAGTKR